MTIEYGLIRRGRWQMLLVPDDRRSLQIFARYHIKALVDAARIQLKRRDRAGGSLCEDGSETKTASARNRDNRKCLERSHGFGIAARMLCWSSSRSALSIGAVSRNFSAPSGSRAAHCGTIRVNWLRITATFPVEVDNLAANAMSRSVHAITELIVASVRACGSSIFASHAWVCAKSPARASWLYAGQSAADSGSSEIV